MLKERIIITRYDAKSVPIDRLAHHAELVLARSDSNFIFEKKGQDWINTGIHFPTQYDDGIDAINFLRAIESSYPIGIVQAGGGSNPDFDRAVQFANLGRRHYMRNADGVADTVKMY